MSLVGSSVASSSSGMSLVGSSVTSSSSSPISRPNPMNLWIREANWLGSSREKPEVNKDVSYNNQVNSLVVLSVLSFSKLSRSFKTIGWKGLISKVFFGAMKEEEEESRKACAFIILSIFADHPYSPVTKQQGELASRGDTTTFSNFFCSSSSSSSLRFSLVIQINFLPSYSLSCWTAYSSIGSIIKITSYPFFFNCSRKGEFSTDRLDS